MLAAVGLKGLEQRHPGQLSGGQQQRVALARSLVVEPSILLLDEPLSNLDAKLRERMRTELKTLQRRTGITFVYVTHDQAEAMALSDRIVVFNKGRVQQVGTPRDVYERPANLFVADFMGLVNKLPGTLIEGHGSAGPRAHRRADDRRPSRRGLERRHRSGHRRHPPGGHPLRCGGAPGSGANILSGRLVESSFLGNIVDHQVDVGGTLIRVQGDRHQSLEPGTSVELAIPIGECVAMRSDAVEDNQQEQDRS